MAVKAKTIPLHRLREHTDQGFHVEKVDVHDMDAEKAIWLGVHRDDHYIFLLQETGRSRCMVDFTDCAMRGLGMLVILPGQVHHYKFSEVGTSGWFVALDVGMVPEAFRPVLEDPLMMQGTFRPEQRDLKPLLQCLELVYGMIGRHPAGSYDRQLIYGMLNVFVGLVATMYAGRAAGGAEQVQRPRMITQAFRKLLAQRYKEQKSPSGYAAELNISLSYLNEVVKSTTGFAVSHWIHHEVVLEAKRLLYHSSSSVKEIAHELGYEDHAYFSRLFTKTEGRTPGAFRRYYRE